jgi:hypothetical protein
LRTSTSKTSIRAATRLHYPVPFSIESISDTMVSTVPLSVKWVYKRNLTHPCCAKQGEYVQSKRERKRCVAVLHSQTQSIRRYLSTFNTMNFHDANVSRGLTLYQSHEFQLAIERVQSSSLPYFLKLFRRNDRLTRMVTHLVSAKFSFGTSNDQQTWKLYSATKFSQIESELLPLLPVGTIGPIESELLLRMMIGGGPN